MDLGPVDHITADAVGEPGDRTSIEVRAGEEIVTVIVEKQQVQRLAASVMEPPEDGADDRTGGGRDDGAQGPLDPRWRAGRLSIGFGRRP